MTKAINSAQAERAKLAQAALRNFRVVLNAIRHHFQQMEKATGVPGAQVWALSIVYKQPGISLGELAAAMDIHQTTASNLLKTLIRNEYVVSEKSEGDKRVSELFLLPLGQKVLLKAPEPHMGILPHALSVLDEKALLDLNAGMDQLCALMKTEPGAERMPLGQGNWR